MKIYQIHEYGGFWEDAFDFIISSYVSEEKAKNELKRLTKEEECWRNMSTKCSRCPLWSYNGEQKDAEKKAKLYCDKYEPFDVDKHYQNEGYESEKCINLHLARENSSYRIEEVEVIE